MAVAAYIYRDARRSTRFSTEQDAVIQDRRRPVAASIRSLSSTGCAFHAPLELPVGETIGIEVAGRVMTATIVWGADGYHGCVFATPLDEGDVAAMLDHRASAEKAPYKLPLLGRIGVIVGLASALWGSLVAGGWAIVRLLARILP